ncbi:hypothetical protein N665_1067s0003 [Sinapis alba]|nr:hypothetical protein N665_1067s0003 [Sinapis alba]
MGSCEFGENVELPKRMFAAGEEHVGIRVNAYHKTGGISQILSALEEVEVEIIRNSSFRKFLELAEKSTYYSRLGRHMMYRQLKVKKKYETWFVFANNPIQFSLREFVVVTGLPCGKFPKENVKPIKNLISVNPYWPWIHVTSIIPQHLDLEVDESVLGWSDEEEDPSVDLMIKLINEGHNFDKALFTDGSTKMDVIRMRHETKTNAAAMAAALAQKPKKRKHLVEASQKEGVDCDNVAAVIVRQFTVELGKVESKVDVLQQSFVELKTDVKHMKYSMKKIDKLFSSLAKMLNGKTHNPTSDMNTHNESSTGQTLPTSSSHNPTHVVIFLVVYFNIYLVINIISNPNCNEEMVENRTEATNGQASLTALSPHPDDVIGNVIASVNNVNCDDGMVSLLITMLMDPFIPTNLQRTRKKKGKLKCEAKVGLIRSRQRKRLSNQPERARGRRLINRTREAELVLFSSGGCTDYDANVITIDGSKVSGKELLEIVESRKPMTANCMFKYTMIDVIMHYIRYLNLSQQSARKFEGVVFLDKKDKLSFEDVSASNTDRFYLPFNLDKKHWVGVCVDCTTWTILVLDCHTTLRNDAMMAKELAPFANMFPYLLKQPGHAMGGVEGCKRITSDVMKNEGRRITVMMYEEYVENI